jgi:hypothetical protein
LNARSAITSISWPQIKTRAPQEWTSPTDPKPGVGKLLQIAVGTEVEQLKQPGVIWYRPPQTPMSLQPVERIQVAQSPPMKPAKAQTAAPKKRPTAEEAPPVSSNRLLQQNLHKADMTQWSLDVRSWG